MWKLALRNVLRHKTRTGMTLLAIVVGVVGLILSGGFVHDIFTQLGEMLIHSQSGHLQVAKEGYFARGQRSPEKFLLQDPEPLRTRILAQAGVADVMGRLYFTGMINNGHTDLPVLGEGVEPAREARMGSGMVMVSGRRLLDADSNGMMLGQGLAASLDLKPGDWATLVLNTAEGAVNSLELQLVGVFQSFSKDYDALALRIPLATAQDLLLTTGVNSLVVSLQRTEDTEAARQGLLPSLANRGLEVNTWLQLNDFYTKTVDMYEAQFAVLRGIILLMVLLSVSNSVNMSVFERVGEFGTMMALGGHSRRVMVLILQENLIIGLAGACVGVILGMGLALLISAIGIPMPPPPNADLTYTAHIRIVPQVVGGAFCIGFLAALGAALLPALRVRRIPVVEALRQSI